MQVRLPSRMIIVLIIKPDLLLHPHPLAPPQGLQLRPISQRRCISRACGTRYRRGSVRMGRAVGRGRGSLGSRRRVGRCRSRRRCEEARHPRPQAHRRRPEGRIVSPRPFSLRYEVVVGVCAGGAERPLSSARNERSLVCLLNSRVFAAGCPAQKSVRTRKERKE